MVDVDVDAIAVAVTVVRAPDPGGVRLHLVVAADRGPEASPTRVPALALVVEIGKLRIPSLGLLEVQ